MKRVTLKNLYVRNSLQEHPSSKSEGGKNASKSPSVFFKILLNRLQLISLATTIHRIFHCFLETQKFTAAVFSKDQSRVTSWLKRPLVGSLDWKGRSFTTGKSAPKKRKLKSLRSLSQFIFLQVVQLHVTQVNVIFHRKLWDRKPRSGPAGSTQSHRQATLKSDVSLHMVRPCKVYVEPQGG